MSDSLLTYILSLAFAVAEKVITYIEFRTKMNALKTPAGFRNPTPEEWEEVARLSLQINERIQKL